MLSTLVDSPREPELEIKVQPRQTSPHPVGGPKPRHHRPPPPPPPPPPRSFRLYKKRFPWIVPSIVVVNSVLFVASMYINNCPHNSNRCIGKSVLGRFAFQSTHENPLLGPSAATLLEMGALHTREVVEKHQVWRLASCMWLHAGVFHIVANMVSLLFVGLRLEEEFGFVRVGLLYVIAGIGGSLWSCLFVHTTISVGASGALFGLLGAMLSELFVNWTIYENKMEAILTLVVIIIINLAVGILPHVDNFAHIGGFVTGFLLGFVLLILPHFGYVKQRTAPGYSSNSPKSKYKLYQYIMLLVSLILLIVGFVVGLNLLLRGVDGNHYCSWCHYLSCVPTPFWTCDAPCSFRKLGNQLNMTCIKNQRHKIYLLDSGNNTAQIQIQKLCVDLCNDLSRKKE